MREYLSKSIPSLNRNKLLGLLAEIDFREYIVSLGLENRISPGGWIVRNVGPGTFGHHTAVFFPQIIRANTDYPAGRQFAEPPRALHTICATMHQIGIESYYCVPVIQRHNEPESISWHSTQLGVPAAQPYAPLVSNIENFSMRTRRYNFLRYRTETDSIPDNSVAEEFTKENLRIAFNTTFMCETSDIDGVFWGQQYTYPIEIKEKTPASDNKVGEYFGLDVGPFVKLAFYAAKRGNLHSLFVVKEIDNAEDRNLVNWWYITFDILAQYASWIPMGGGVNMQGGGSTVVKIPKAEFRQLDAASITTL
jgi:hypothetical protein